MKKTKKNTNKSFVEKLKRIPSAILRFVKRHRWFQILLVTLAMLSLVFTVMVVHYNFKHRNDPVILGVSFSKKYADELGIDWQDNFTALLDDLEFRNFRLMSYWDEVEPENNQYDFSILDWQMNEAAKRNAKVNLAIGQRQPRWPECHDPSWAKELDEDTFNEALYDYLSVVVNRYKDHPALEQYQLENEIFNDLFGDCERTDRSRVQTEFDLVKSIDTVHPVSINVASQEGVPPIRGPIGDKIGFSVYRIANGDFFGKNIYFYMPYPAFYHTIRAEFVELVHGTPTFIHELQTEPWGPVATKNLTIEEQDQSMSVEQIKNNVHFGLSTGIKEIYMWGGEWWYWRMTKFNDNSQWETVRNLLIDKQG